MLRKHNRLFLKLSVSGAIDHVPCQPINLEGAMRDGMQDAGDKN
jgi:hypothetical protein